MARTGKIYKKKKRRSPSQHTSVSALESSGSRVRLQKVISEMHSFGRRSRDEIEEIIKIQTKELGWFFLLFVGYVLFGAFTFFYIEDCSGASMADDSTTPSLHDKIFPVRYINLTNTCFQLYTDWINILHNVTQPQDLPCIPQNHSEFSRFLKLCQLKIHNSTENYVIQGYERKCVIDAFQILKYSEFCIFTLLTVGYGNTVPVTIIGRYLLILYSIIGVPIAVTMYSVAGKLLILMFTLLVRFVYRKTNQSEPSTTTERLSVLAVSLVAMFIIILIGCGVTTRDNMENFTYHTSIYFWFVSITTIGYGDVHFERNRHLDSPHFLMLSAINLLFGMGIVAAIIEAFAMALEKRGMDAMALSEETPMQFQKEIDLNAFNESWIKNSIVAGGIALDINSSATKKNFSRTSLNSGFSLDRQKDGLYGESFSRRSSTRSNTSYLHA